MIDVAVIVVNWNVRDLLYRCLSSVFATPSALALHVVVVDNASSDGSPEMVRREFPQVQLIANARNRGFTAGNNQALRALGFGKEGSELPRYALLLNPDAELVGDALETMVAFMDAHPDVGVVGPQLRFPDGRIQSSRRRFPTLATAFLESTVLQQWWPDNPVARRYYVLDRPDDVVQDVDWVVGACMLVRREAILDVGLLDEGFFMYSEELDWCRRIKERGWRVVYLPTARVIHHEGRSSAQVVPARHIHFQRSKVRYFRKHHSAWAAELLRAFLLLSYVYQLLLEGGKWLLGHKRPLRAARVQAYWQVLRSGLR